MQYNINEIKMKEEVFMNILSWINTNLNMHFWVGLFMGGLSFAIYDICYKRNEEKTKKIIGNVFYIYMFFIFFFILMVADTGQPNSIILAVAFFPFVEKLIKTRFSLFEEKEWNLLFSFLIFIVLTLLCIPGLSILTYFFEFLVVHCKRINLEECNIINDIMSKTVYLISTYTFLLSIINEKNENKDESESKLIKADKDKSINSEKIQLQYKDRKIKTLANILILVFFFVYTFIIEISKY